MRIYNGTKKVLTLPYTGGETLTIPAHQPSGNVLCSPEFLSTVITAYNTEEIAIIASGPFEISACANVPTATQYVVQSLDEAIARFNPDAKVKLEAEKAKEQEEVKEKEPTPEKEEDQKPKLKPETIKKKDKKEKTENENETPEEKAE